MYIGPHKEKNSWIISWSLFNVMLGFPVPTAREWGLVNMDSPRVNIRYDITEGRHPHAYAPESRESDDGKRLGIQASKVINGETKTVETHHRSISLQLMQSCIRLLVYRKHLTKIDEACRSEMSKENK